MKIAVVCSPEFRDKKLLATTMAKIVEKQDKKPTILCRPEDEIVIEWAHKNWLTTEIYREMSSRSTATAERDADMVNNAEGLVAFWGGEDDIEEMVDRAKNRKIKVKVVKV